MAQFASGSFTGADGTELSAHDAAWTRHTSYTANSVISANRLRGSTASSSAYWHSGTPASADYSVSADLFTKTADGGDGGTGVIGRVDTAANTFYMARYVGTVADGWQLFKAVAGVFTQLGSTTTQSLTDETAYNVKLEMIGTAIKLYKEGSGSATISATDSSITAAGKAGVRFILDALVSNTAGLHLDNFSADDTGASPTVITLDPAALNLTPQSTQSTVAATLTVADFKLTPQDTQNSVTNTLTAPAFDFVTHDITAENASTATVTLDTATFDFVANDNQSALYAELSTATCDFVANDIQNTLRVELTTGTFDFAGRDTQNRLGLLLENAIFDFVARSITAGDPLTPTTGRATNMMLMGVGN